MSEHPASFFTWTHPCAMTLIWVAPPVMYPLVIIHNTTGSYAVGIEEKAHSQGWRTTRGVFGDDPAVRKNEANSREKPIILNTWIPLEWVKRWVTDHHQVPFTFHVGHRRDLSAPGTTRILNSRMYLVQVLWVFVFVRHVITDLSPSACTKLELDHMRRKRVEAVRGQILSKLRLSSPPDGPVSNEVPLQFQALFNSTKKLLEELNKERRHNCGSANAEDEYYAKEILRIHMMDEPTEDSKLKRWFAKHLWADMDRSTLMQHASVMQGATLQTFSMDYRLHLKIFYFCVDCITK